MRYISPGCALKKIEGSPLLLNHKIYGAQHMICMKKVRFSSRPRAKVGAWGQQAQLKHRAVSSFKNNRGLVALLLQIIYCKWCLQQSLYLIPPCLYLQGVPKVRSANLMHYNFWSKLYFYMKFLEDVYFSIKYMCSEFQWLACPFCFFYHIL